MASIIPTLNSVKRRMTSGERRFAERLESHLEDDYLCWYDVPIGPRTMHPDFVVLHPRRGILILEVKDWRKENIQKMDKMTAYIHQSNGLKKAINPLQQARGYAHQIVSLLEKDRSLVRSKNESYAGKLSFPWGYGVVLANMMRKIFDSTDLHEVLPSNRVICQDEMLGNIDPEDFQKRLWDMYTVAFPTVMTMPQIDRVRWHLFPEIRIPNKQSELGFEAAEQDTPESIPDLMRVMDLQQEQLARSLGEGHRIIHGAAGSGKTMILGYRAVQLAGLVAKPILILCYNKSLASFLRDLIVDKGLTDKVSVRNFHGWCYDQLKLFGIEPPPQGDDFFINLVDKVIQSTENGNIPRAQYGAVLIDEGHDFRPEWFKLLTQMIDPGTNSLLVLYDDAQSIYDIKSHRNFSFKSVGIQAQGRTTILKLNYRNTKEVLDTAYEFSREFLRPEEADEDGVPLVAPESAGRRGPMPEYLEFSDAQREFEYVTDRVLELQQGGTPLGDIAILYRNKFIANKISLLLKRKRIAFDWSKMGSGSTDGSVEKVRLLTLHSSKGLEFPLVIIPGLGHMPGEYPPEDEAKLLYVGMTRATESLIMTSHSDSDFAKRVKAILNRKTS